MIPINEAYQQIGTQLAVRLGHPAVNGLYLPAPVADETFRDEFGSYPAGTWLRSPHMSEHYPFADEETIIWVKVGHLPR